MKKHVLSRKALTRSCALALGVVTALSGAAFTLAPAPAHAGISIGIGISVGVAPPPLPIYEQPPIPAVGYIWTPGYWSYSDDGGYFWVPGTWVMAPFTGALWTPGYWGWSGGAFMFHQGYWGTQVGFYGGVNYGFGYTGDGYAGGHWGPGGFYYNQSVNQFGGTHITNVYNQTVVNNVTVNHVSYNGGTGGITAQPTPQQAAFAQQQHTPPVAAQEQHVQMASQNQALRASVNHGNPTIAATARPAAFTGAGVVAARGPGGPVSPESLQPHPAAAANHPQPNVQPNGEPRSAGFAPHPNPAAPANHPVNEPANRPANEPAPHPANEPAPANHAVTERPAGVNDRPVHYAPHPQPQPEPRPEAQPRPEPAAAPHPAEQQFHSEPARPAPAPRPEPAREAPHEPAPHAAPPHPAPRPQPPKKDEHQDHPPGG